MVKKEPVSINLQSIFMIIPILDLYSAYRVEKLRKYLLFIISYAIVVVTLLLILFPIDDEPSLSESNFGGDVIGLGIELIAIGISIILIRKWSKKWNQQFENQSKENEQ